MNNYLIIGIIFILVLGMLQLISINIRLRTDIKRRDISISNLELNYAEITDKYNTLKAKYGEFLRSTID